jgi:hypothetical protein
MNKFAFTAGVIAAALAFRDEVGKNEEKESLRLLDSGGDSDEALDHNEAALFEAFTTFVQNKLATSTALKQHPFADDLLCVASAKAGEPTFTLRGQDITAAHVVRLWADLQSLNPDNGTDNWRKTDKAIEIAEKMESFEDRKWAD